MEAKDNRKRAADQIKILDYSKAAPEDFDSDLYAKVAHNKKANTGVLRY